MTIQQIKDLIDQDITANGSGEITGEVLNTILKAMLDAVDAAKLDSTSAVVTKVNAMPAITNYNSTNDRVNINGTTYQLTEYVPTPNYYVGWTTGNKTTFNQLTDSQLAAIASGKYSDTDKTYTRAFGADNIFFLLYLDNAVPTIIFTSQGTQMQQNIITDDNFSSHADVTIGTMTYKLFGIYLTGNDPTDSITLNF